MGSHSRAPVQEQHAKRSSPQPEAQEHRPISVCVGAGGPSEIFEPARFESAINACTTGWEVLDLALQYRPPLRVDRRPLPLHIASVIELRGRSFQDPESHRQQQLAIIEKLSLSFPIVDSSPRLDLLEHLAKLTGSPDVNLASDSLPGFKLVGEQLVTGLWEQKLTGPRLRLSELKTKLQNVLAKHKAERARGIFRLPHKRDQPGLLKQLRAEAEKGWRDKERSVEETEAAIGDFCALLYFGVPQNDKVRGCLDPAEITALCSLLETVYMCGLDGLAAMLRKIRKEWGNVELVFSKEDWRAGFRQLRLHPGHRRYFVAAAVDEQGRIVCFVPNYLIFGGSRCVPQFCRVSEAFERVCTGLLWVVTNHHVDDHIIVEQPGLIKSARQSVRKLAQILQIELANDKALPPWCSVCASDGCVGAPLCASCGSCHVCSSNDCKECVPFGTTEGPALGPILRLPTKSEREAGVVACFSLDQVRTQKYTRKLSTVRPASKAAPGAIKKIAGQVEWSDAAVMGRQLRAFLWPFRDHEKLLTAVLPSPALCAAAKCISVIFLGFPVKKVMATDVARTYFVAFTDARGSVSAVWGSECIGGVLFS